MDKHDESTTIQGDIELSHNQVQMLKDWRNSDTHVDFYDWYDEITELLDTLANLMEVSNESNEKDLPATP